MRCKWRGDGGAKRGGLALRLFVVLLVLALALAAGVGFMLHYLRYQTSDEEKVHLLTETTLKHMGGREDAHSAATASASARSGVAAVYICIWSCDIRLLALSIKTLRARGGFCGDTFVAVDNSQRRQLSKLNIQLPSNTHLVLVRSPASLCTARSQAMSFCAKRLKPQLFSLVPHNITTLLYIDADVLVSRPLGALLRKAGHSNERQHSSPTRDVWLMFPDMLCSDCNRYNTGIMLLHRARIESHGVCSEQCESGAPAQPRAVSLHSCLSLWLSAMDTGLFKRDQEALDGVLGVRPFARLLTPPWARSKASKNGGAAQQRVEAVAKWLHAAATTVPKAECTSLSLDAILHAANAASTASNAGAGAGAGAGDVHEVMRRVDSCVGEARGSCRSLVQQLPRWRQRYIDGGMWQPLLAYHEWFVHLLGIKRFANLWPEVNRFFVDSEAELLQHPRCLLQLTAPSVVTAGISDTCGCVST